MSEASASRPLPELRNFGAEFWRTAARGILVVPRCLDCGQTFWHPRPRCPHCGSAKVDWLTVSGGGAIHTYTVVRQSADAFFKSKTPYVVAIVQLDGGPKIMSEVIDVDVETMEIGMRVTVAFEAAEQGIAIPLFRPAVR
jgi:uncharacterized protein